MVSLRFTVCAVAVLLAVFQPATSLQCYSCSADEKDSCKDNGAKIPCTEKCLQISDADGNLYQRTCGTEKFCKLFADCEMCTEELCNSSPAVLPSFLVFGVASAIIAKYFY